MKHLEKSSRLDSGPVKVNSNQFYGIEINGFAAALARTELLAAEYKMMCETEEILKEFISQPVSDVPVD